MTRGLAVGRRRRLLHGCAAGASGVAGLLSLAACGGGTATQPATAVATPAGASGPQQLTLHADDKLRFLPSQLKASPGAIAITLVDDGNVPHTLRVKGLEPFIRNVDGHSSASVTLTLPKAGTYYVECDYHPGMVATLTVGAP